ncbi:MAG: hypothetical protein AAF560_31955 [Acidobacteriota bacterium]
MIDTDTQGVTTTIGVGDLPIGVAASDGESRVYVTNLDSDTVSVIDTATNTVLTTVSVGAVPHAHGDFVGPGPRLARTIHRRIARFHCGPTACTPMLLSHSLKTAC